MQNNNNGKNIPSLTNIFVEDQPVGLLFAPTSTIIENFVDDHLRSKGVKPYGVKVMASKGNDKNAPRLTCAVFMSENSEDVGRRRNNNNTNTNGIFPGLVGKIDNGDNSGKGGNFSERFKSAIGLFTRGEKIKSRSTRVGKENIVIVDLDVLTILAAMYDVNPAFHQIIIQEVTEIDRNRGTLLIGFAKLRRNRSTNNHNGDMLTRLYRNAH